ncbi:MAG: Secretion system C-terminal sorting domain, partial [Bacteroidota bacterium]
EVLDFYSFDLTGQRTYLNTISESSPYYMLEDAMIESDGDRMVLLTRIYDGLYRTETYNEYFSLVTTEEAQTNSLNFYSLMLHQRLNADSVLIIRQHEDWLTRNFQWEFEWWKSPNALIRQKYMNTDTYTNQLDYGNTYRSGYSEAILDTLHRQILVYAYESSSSQTSEYARRIYYYDYDFNVLCIDSMLLPDWASRYQLMTLDGQSYFSYYNQTSTAFHPIHCGSTQQEAPQDTSSVAEALVIYPNPSNGLFYVANASHLPTLIRIFSLQGTLLYEDYSSEELIVLDVHALTNGTYSLQLQTPIQTQTQTIYIE